MKIESDLKRFEREREREREKLVDAKFKVFSSKTFFLTTKAKNIFYLPLNILRLKVNLKVIPFQTCWDIFNLLMKIRIYLCTCYMLYLCTCYMVYDCTCYMVYQFTCFMVFLYTWCMVFLYTCSMVYLYTCYRYWFTFTLPIGIVIPIHVPY